MMRPLIRNCSALAIAGALFASTVQAAGIDFDSNGWYRWEVPASANGQSACCYRYHGSRQANAGCSLGDGEGGIQVTTDCEGFSDAMNLYVEVRDGEVHEIRPLSASCPVTADTEVQQLEGVTTDQSLEWLMEQLDGNRRLREQAIMAISFHAEQPALDALVSIVEGPQHDQGSREKALFWLVQSNSDAAYAYLDNLLR